jgi:putative phosphoesterase
MRIGIFSDIHANLPALEAVLGALQHCDRIFYLGDSVALGPYPAETLTTLLGNPHSNITYIMGNHDVAYADKVYPPDMPAIQLEHEHWTHTQIGDSHVEAVRQWHYIYREEIEGVHFTFIHYPHEGTTFFSEVPATPADLDEMFRGVNEDTDVICFGHTHKITDVRGKAHYLNPGAAGCMPTATAPYLIIEVWDGKYTLHPHSIAYADEALMAEFDRQQIPDRDEIRRIFFGGR